MRTRIPLHVRLRASWFGILLLAGMFAVIILATGAYRSWKALTAAGIGLVAALLVGSGLRRLQGSLEPAIMPVKFGRRDARGAPVVAQDIRLNDLALDHLEALRLVTHLQASTPWISRRSGIVVLMIASVGGWLVWLRVGPPLIGRDNALIFGVVVLLLIAFIISRIRRHASLANVSDGLLAVGRCAACGYDLKYLPSESDGCTVCAECGAAWRIGFQRQGRRTDADSDDVAAA